MSDFDNFIQLYNLGDRYFSNMDFTGQNFTGMDLKGITFDICNFTDAKIIDCGLSAAKFKNCNMTAALVQSKPPTNRDIFQTIFDHCQGHRFAIRNSRIYLNLAYCVLPDMEIRDCIIAITATHCNLASIRFADVLMEDSYINHVVLSGAIVTNTKIKGTRFHESKFDWANLSNCNIRDTVLDKCRFYGTDMGRAGLAGLVNKGSNFYAALIPFQTLQEDERGYDLSWSYGRETDKDGEPILMFYRGCREFTYEQAVAHWESNSYAIRTAEINRVSWKTRGKLILAAIEYIKTVVESGGIVLDPLSDKD